MVSMDFVSFLRLSNYFYKNTSILLNKVDHERVKVTLINGYKVRICKYFGIKRVLILAVLSMTILAFDQGSVRRDYYLCSGHSIDL